MFYVAHRLFAAHDRQLGAAAATALAARIGPDNVFLPFCDTDEEDLVADVKGRRLFDLDRQRLNRLHGMLAILHGPSLDDGVCMEIGYAAALGVPIVVFTTDFQTYGPTETGPEIAFADPLIETVTTDIVRTHRLGPPADDPDRFRGFATRNALQINAGIDHAVTRLLASAASTPTTNTARPAVTDTVFVEPSPYGSPTDWHHLVEHHSTDTQRHDAQRQLALHPMETAKADWDAALSSHTLIVNVAGPETPPGAAVLIGAAVATGKRVLAYSPHSLWTYAHGREPNWRNLMIQYSITRQLVTLDLQHCTR
jgi:nucleoside 2-deoxyribosyltransferase